jgi:hypothetical protein
MEKKEKKKEKKPVEPRSSTVRSRHPKHDINTISTHFNNAVEQHVHPQRTRKTVDYKTLDGGDPNLVCHPAFHAKLGDPENESEKSPVRVKSTDPPSPLPVYFPKAHSSDGVEASASKPPVQASGEESVVVIPGSTKHFTTLRETEFIKSYLTSSHQHCIIKCSRSPGQSIDTENFVTTVVDCDTGEEAKENQRTSIEQWEAEEGYLKILNADYST